MAALYGGEPGVPAVRREVVVRADPRSGRLVRSVVATSKHVSQTPSAAAPTVSLARSEAIEDTVTQIAAEHSLPPQLLHSVIRVESNYNPVAVSEKGALGLMQLIPATARRFGVSDVFNPVENIQGGAKYLRYLLDLYHGDYRLALAAYNAGEGAVQKYGGVPPYRETQNYVKLVGKQLQNPVKVQAKPAENKPGEGKTAEPHVREIVETDGTVRYVSR